MTLAETRWRSHALVLALGTFAMGTDAFVIAGVLPPIAAQLKVSIEAAGQLVTVFSVAYAVLAPVLALLTARWSRRTVLVTALAVFAIGNAITAVAPSYPLVLASRVVAAAGAGMFTASASATAAMIAGEERRGRAISLVMLGITSSLVLGAPLGTFIGGTLGWRATMWFLVVLAALIIPVLAVRLPHLLPPSRGGFRELLTPMRDRRVLGVLLGTVAAFTGIYIPYTYLSAVYEPATGGDPAPLAVLLLVFGLAGTAGNLLAGHLADRWGAGRVILPVTSILAVVFLAVPAFRGTLGTAVPAVVVSAALSFMVTTPQQQLIIALAPDAPAVVTSLYQSALYLAVSLSGALGAVALSLVGQTWLTVVAAGFLALAGIINSTRRGFGVGERSAGRFPAEPPQ